MEDPLFEKKLDDLLPSEDTTRRAVPSWVVTEHHHAPRWAGLPGPELRRVAVLRECLLAATALRAVTDLTVVGLLAEDRGHPGSDLTAVLLTLAGLVVLAGVVVLVLLAGHLYQPVWVAAAVVGATVPFVGLAVMLAAVGRAGTALRHNGIRVGLCGANRQDLAEYVPGAPPKVRLPRLGW